MFIPNRVASILNQAGIGYGGHGAAAVVFHVVERTVMGRSLTRCGMNCLLTDVGREAAWEDDLVWCFSLEYLSNGGKSWMMGVKTWDVVPS